MLLFLDDSDRRRALMEPFWGKDTIFCETAAACIEIIKLNPLITKISLDHDLGGQTFVDSNREDCGMEVVRYLETVNIPRRFKYVKVHSWNEPAAKEMVKRLREAGYDSIWHPFSGASR